jgi:hypothetical protein
MILSYVYKYSFHNTILNDFHIIWITCWFINWKLYCPSFFWRNISIECSPICLFFQMVSFRPIDSQKSLLISLFPHSRHMLHPHHYPCYVLGKETTFVLSLISQGCQCRNFLNQGIVRRHIYFIYNKVYIQNVVYEKYGKFQWMIV